MFPDKKYERLGYLQKRWQVSQEDIYYAVENGILKTSIWLPLRCVERGVLKDRKFVFENHEFLDGFVGLRPQDTRAIFSHGRAKLRTFTSIEECTHILRICYEPPQPSLSVSINDLLVLQKDKEAFEAAYNLDNLTQPEAPSLEDKKFIMSDIFRASEDYRHVILREKDYYFGDIQAKIIEMLYDAALSRNPWVHGKTLLYESGSTAERIRDIFKKKRKKKDSSDEDSRDWRDVIVSNERGLYRLNVPLLYNSGDDLAKAA